MLDLNFLLIEYDLLSLDNLLLFLELVLQLLPAVASLGKFASECFFLVLLVSLQHLTDLVEVVIELGHELLLVLSGQLYAAISLHLLQQVALPLIGVLVQLVQHMVLLNLKAFLRFLGLLLLLLSIGFVLSIPLLLFLGLALIVTSFTLHTLVLLLLALSIVLVTVGVVSLKCSPIRFNDLLKLKDLIKQLLVCQSLAGLVIIKQSISTSIVLLGRAHVEQPPNLDHMLVQFLLEIFNLLQLKHTFLISAVFFPELSVLLVLCSLLFELLLGAQDLTSLVEDVESL